MAFLAGRRPSAAAVIAVGALVCVMSGTAVATGSHQNGNHLIAKHTLSGNRLVNDTITGKQIKAPVWHTFALVNGWTAYNVDNYGTPAYAIDAQGFIHLRGAVSHVSATSGTFGVLPTGFRPAETFVFVPAASTNGANDPQTVVLVVQHTGEVTAEGGAGATLNFVSLAGVTFATA